MAMINLTRFVMGSEQWRSCSGLKVFVKMLRIGMRLSKSGLGASKRAWRM